ncbi:DUF488 domain-containing protein [Brevibacterium litoralis]|uniref:DUF488 domain-containing protein n=1 Tax=Brevibacterium litoralis TaxID=3138935 RepID=UPI0032EB9342
MDEDGTGRRRVDPRGGTIRIARVYETPRASDGYRVLVDRLWPRGVSKEKAALDDWAQDVAPSPELRTWWDHDPERIDAFTERYRAELAGNPAVDRLLELWETGEDLTLLYAARDPHVNHARILRDHLVELATARAAFRAHPAGGAHPSGGRAHGPVPIDEPIGEPVCLLDRVCPDCGALKPDGSADCPRCGASADPS